MSVTFAPDHEKKASERQRSGHATLKQLRCRRAGGKKNRVLHAHVVGRQCAQHTANLSCRVPMRATIRTRSAVLALLPPEQAVTIQQANGKPATADAHDFTQGRRPVSDETQSSDRNDEIEAFVI